MNRGWIASFPVFGRGFDSHRPLHKPHDAVDLTRLTSLKATQKQLVLDGTQLDGRFNRLILLD